MPYRLVYRLPLDGTSKLLNFNPDKKCDIFEKKGAFCMKLWLVISKSKRQKKARITGFEKKAAQLAFVKKLRLEKDTNFSFTLEKVDIEKLYEAEKKVLKR